MEQEIRMGNCGWTKNSFSLDSWQCV